MPRLGLEGPASNQVEESDNWAYWIVWIRWSGIGDPQEYKALVDTGAQCTLITSNHIGAKSISIAGVARANCVGG